jgi:O-antigen/teichoic acid export membrane protein
MAFVLPLAAILITTVFYYLFREQIIGLFKPEDIPFIRRYYLLLPLFALLFAYLIVFEQYLISELKVAKATFNKEIVLRGLNLVIIILFGTGFISFDLLIWSTVLIYLIPIAFSWYFSKRDAGFVLSRRWNVFPGEEKKKIFDFAWYHSLINVQASLMGFLDALMLPLLAPEGLSAVAVYMGANFVTSFLQIPYRAMQSATFPIMAQAFRDNDTVKVKDVFVRSSMNILIASAGMFLLIACSLDHIVATLPEGYEAITALFFIIALGRMVDMATGMNDHVLSISNLYRYNFYISLILVVLLIVFNWLLIPVYGVYGAAWGTSLAVILFNFIKFFLVKHKLQLQPFSFQTLKVLFAASLTFLVGYFLPFFSNLFLDLFIRSGIIALTYLALLVVLKPSPDLTEYVRNTIKNRRLF